MICHKSLRNMVLNDAPGDLKKIRKTTDATDEDEESKSYMILLL